MSSAITWKIPSDNLQPVLVSPVMMPWAKFWNGCIWLHDYLWNWYSRVLCLTACMSLNLKNQKWIFIWDEINVKHKSIHMLKAFYNHDGVGLTMNVKHLILFSFFVRCCWLSLLSSSFEATCCTHLHTVIWSKVKHCKAGLLHLPVKTDESVISNCAVTDRVPLAVSRWKS